MKRLYRLTAATVALAQALAACTVEGSPPAPPVPPAPPAPEAPITVPPHQRPVALRVILRGAPDAKDATALTLYDTGGARPVELAFASDTLGIYALRPGHYAVDRIDGFACQGLGFTIDPRDGLVALGTLVLEVPPDAPDHPAVSVVPPQDAERRLAAERLATPYGLARSATVKQRADARCGVAPKGPSAGSVVGQILLLSAVAVVMLPLAVAMDPGVGQGKIK